MKLNKSFEQATYVMTMLALQKDHRPVKSHVLSQVLQVSDSYLKKVLMKLARAGLISANANKNGGYQLARPVTQISLKDIFLALELQKDIIDFKHVATNVYDDQEHVKQVEELILTTLDEGVQDFLARLDQLKVSDLLHPGAYENGVIEWQDRLK